MGRKNIKAAILKVLREFYPGIPDLQNSFIREYKETYEERLIEMTLNVRFFSKALINALSNTFQTDDISFEVVLTAYSRVSLAHFRPDIARAIESGPMDVLYIPGVVKRDKHCLYIAETKVIIRNANMDQIFRKSTIRKHAPIGRFDLEVE